MGERRLGLREHSHDLEPEAGVERRAPGDQRVDRGAVGGYGVHLGHEADEAALAQKVASWSRPAGAVRLSETLLAAPETWLRARCTSSRRPRTAFTCSTGPSVGSSAESACGPTSQSAPRSRRQGEPPNGFPGSKIDARKSTLPPSHVRPSTSAAYHSAADGSKRKVKKTTVGARAAVDDALGRLDGERERLLEQERSPGLGGAQRDPRLHVRRHREGDGVHRRDQLVDVGVGAGAVLRRERLGLRRVAAPDADELRLRMRADAGRVHGVRPEAGADQAEAHPLILAGGTRTARTRA